MTDQTKTAAIEDVLSSIRKLVAEESGFGERATSGRSVSESSDQTFLAAFAPPPVAASAPVAAPADRLLLTESLRVVPPDPVPVATRATPAPEPMPSAPSAVAPDTKLADAEEVAKQAQPLKLQDLSPEPEATAEVSTDDMLRQLVMQEVSRALDAGEESAEESPEASDQVSANTDLSAQAAEGAARAWAADAVRGSSDALDRKIEALEKLLARNASEAEVPDDGAPRFTVQVRPAASAAASHEVPATEGAKAGDLANGEAPEEGLAAKAPAALGSDASDRPEADVDEAAVLRQMIAAILRRELEGQLGERLTRNLRKMVQQEIQRAMLTRDLD